MFRKLRRAKQALSFAECQEVLYQNEYGVLALHGDDGYPYAVPVNYVYDGRQLYFHGARKGHRVDAVARNAKASFCVVAEHTAAPEKYTSLYRSVIVFGEMRVLQEPEKRLAIEKLSIRFAPHHTPERREAAINADYPPLCMTALTAEHISGKVAQELLSKRQTPETMSPHKDKKRQ